LLDVGSWSVFQNRYLFQSLEKSGRVLERDCRGEQITNEQQRSATPSTGEKNRASVRRASLIGRGGGKT